MSRALHLQQTRLVKYPGISELAGPAREGGPDQAAPMGRKGRTMKIRLRLFSTLRRYAPEGKNGLEREVAERSRVGEVMTGLGIPKETMAVILVNGRLADGDRELSPGDELVLFPPVEGGLARYFVKTAKRNVN